MLSVFIMLKK